MAEDCPKVEDEMIAQTPEMLALILQDPERSAIYNGPNHDKIVAALQKRKAIFQLIMNLLPDEPRLRLEIISDVLGAMTVMAGADCEHGSCYIFSEISQSIAMWSARMPILSVPGIGESEGERPN